MRMFDLAAEQRTKTGKNINRRHRREGFIPAVIYGGKDTHMIRIPEKDFNTINKIHKHENVMVNLKMQGKDVSCLIKDTQRDPVKNYYLHVDFLELVEGRRIHITVPLELDGVAPGIKEGGILEHFIYQMSIECLPKDMPDVVKADISGLNIGDSIHISDINVPDGVIILDNPEQTVAMVGLPTKIVEPESEEEITEGEEPADSKESAPETEENKEPKK